ncbi:MAG: hypothetical protein WC860_07580 [Candidatus Margulisiibacteriota bacterium]|jgi:hypothetical protein
MKIFVFGFLFVLALTSNGLCSPLNNQGKTLLHQASIQEIISSENYLNATVSITGIFKGNDSKIGPPPVTRSDFILEDTTGQIFVTGPFPIGLTRKDCGKTISIKAKVKSTTLTLAGKKLKIIYLEIK